MYGFRGGCLEHATERDKGRPFLGLMSVLFYHVIRGL
jgi:hypothetical protein